MDEGTIYRKADYRDIEQIVKFRMMLLHESMPSIGTENEWKEVEERIRVYYEKNIPEGNHVVFNAYIGGNCVGTGGISFYKVLPTYYKPTGVRGYIANLYVESQYRRRGIASALLGMLTEEAYERGVRYITLESTKDGEKLYLKNNFAHIPQEMQYVNETFEGCEWKDD